MDLSTIIGLLLGLFGLLGGFVFEGGTVGALMQGTAAMIVFGGTFGAVIAGTPLKKLKKVPYILKMAFMEKKYSPHEMIDQLVELSTLSRREGLLALEPELEKFEDDTFLYEGLQMTIDGMEGDLIRDILDREMELYETQHLDLAKVFESAGGFAPTMGIIGTVMGLVHVLGKLSNPKALGPLIATAFIATLYGVASANVIYLPLYNKIKSRIADEILIKELQAEALLSIQHGENPNILRKKLVTFAAKEAPAKDKANQEEDPVEESEAM